MNVPFGGRCFGAGTPWAGLLALSLLFLHVVHSLSSINNEEGHEPALPRAKLLNSAQPG